jgi:hypothetical protein
VAEDHGYEFRLTFFEREVFLANDEDEEVGPFRRNIVKSEYRQIWSAWQYQA